MGGNDSAALAGTLTRLIGQVDAGDPIAQDQLCELVYNELRAIGRLQRARRNDCSLSTTDVVHEFLARILADGRLGKLKNRRYFYAAASNQINRLIVDHWRQEHAQKRGGDYRQVDIEPWLGELIDSAADRCGGDLEALDMALAQLKNDRPRQHEIVQLKFFAGLTNDQVAEVLDISVDTVKRDWKIARARLGALLGDS